MRRLISCSVKLRLPRHAAIIYSHSNISLTKETEPEFKADAEAVNLFDFGLISQPEMQFYDDYLYPFTLPALKRLQISDYFMISVRTLNLSPSD